LCVRECAVGQGELIGAVSARLMAWHQCTQCSEKFRKKGERDAHNKKAHQRSCKLLGGRITATKLTRNGKWVCPFAACCKLLASPSTLAKHYEKFHGSAVVADPITTPPLPGGHIPQAQNSSDGSSTEGDDFVGLILVIGRM
jgi:hypothetical protein